MFAMADAKAFRGYEDVGRAYVVVYVKEHVAPHTIFLAEQMVSNCRRKKLDLQRFNIVLILPFQPHNITNVFVVDLEVILEISQVQPKVDVSADHGELSRGQR